ncbi:unnamed protein product [Nippostrongylus brasiliensis]|uniref:Kunitz/Bovine pancreatic trypsin inhibitor domain protein n=1 Tax=Nippostrongylus brasiliensis TaxID=27835 RepID=A0A0N4Y690_NIPBR|nr:unnamed protein product [Nippostrongylus brasiliensis]
MFEYTGCQGNDNNFETVLDCQNFCKNAIPEPKCIQGQAYRNQFGDFITCATGLGCPSNYECYYDGEQWAFTCSLNADPGVQCGSGSTFRFFYNAQTQNCESFQYSGCDGNSNNFANRELCEQHCSVGGCPYGGTPLRDHSGMIAVCSGQESCPSSHECSPVVVGLSTINRCCPTRGYMCGLPPQQGTQCGSNFVPRFYFNIVTGKCTSFQFGGCDGNYNNFLTVQQCRGFCYSSSCPAGNVVYVDPNSQMPIHCNEALSNSCPSGHTCTFNALINSHVCCGASDQGVCPDQEKAFISTADMSPRECVVNIEASCPANYLCRFNMQRNKYYCCTSITGRTCPVGKFLHKDSQTSVPTRCTMGRSDQCADGYSCQSYLPDASQGFCCTSNAVCPDDAEFYVDDHSQQPRACTMGSFVSCPHGYTCRSSTSAVEGFCCRSGSASLPAAITDGCPPGNFVFIDEAGQAAACDPFNPPNAPCPDDFTCQWSVANQKYQCCGSSPPTPSVRSSDGCPNAQIAYRNKNTVQVCTAGSTTCPAGYFCQFSSANRQFQCCGVGGGCPADSVAFVGLSGEPQQCVVGQSKCPVGFACQRASGGRRHICCTTRTVTCSADEILMEGACLPLVHPGQSCRLSEQCTGGSVCEDELCQCPSPMQLIGGFCHADIKSSCTNGVCECNTGLVNLNGKCASASARTKITQSKAVSTRCANPKSKVLISKESGRVVFCSQKAAKQCPRGYSCQISVKRTQYICCSDDSQSVCPTGRVPYLLNGVPQQCTKQRCPRGAIVSVLGSADRRHLLQIGEQLSSERCQHRCLYFVGKCRLDKGSGHQNHRPERQTGSGRVGDACSFNTDCLTGMFCNSGLCSCLTSYIAAESYCYQKIDPGQPGCVYNEQCSAVWPDAFCDTSAGVGTCRCGENKVERATRDGHVCLDVLDGNQNVLAITCPLPEGAGYTSALSDSHHPRQSDGAGPVLCNTDSMITQQSGENVGDGSTACLFPSTNSYIADLYNCVGFVSTVDLTTSGFSEKANGICCPNRAFTCIQPTATGPNPTEPRWWYNAITGMCQQFLWDPTAVGPGEHSPNNFRTIEHCESYCRDGCTRGAPEYEVRTSFHEETPITGCSQSTTCSNNFECKTGTAPSTRFFYDPAAGKCSPFTYMGAAGNYNNFLSRIDCELYCARLQCDRGNPLRIGDVTQACQSNNDCPSTHECKADQGVCCPRMRCQGNDNNFETLVDCQTFCRNAAPEPRCLQGQAYKDSVGKFVTCSTNRAASSCPVNYECYYDGNMFGCCPTKAFTCSLVSSPGKTCGPGVSFKFFYSSQTQECESFEYLGCDGNSNNFASRQECESYCGVGAYICALPPQQGSSLCSGGVSSVTRYYFNIVTKKCSPFAFNGCDGNPNNFASLTQCNNFCTASACKAGDVVYLNPNTQTPISCHDDIQNNCPKNFKCVFDSLTDSSVCCGATDMGVCPDGEKAYLNAMDMTVRECLINEPNSCPTNYLCRFNPSRNRYFCCGSTKSNYCPVGRAPFKDQMSLQTMRCTMNAHVSSCPDGFECQSDVRDALQGYCCSVSADGCLSRQKAFVDTGTGKPQVCTSAKMSCPAGYFCQFSQQNKQFQCCGIPSDCPSPMVAFIGISGEHQRCSNSGGQPCPDGFICVKGKRNEDICCAGGEVCEPSQVSVEGRCLPRQLVGAVCEHSEQCLGGSTCRDGSCQCPEGTMEQKQRCVANKKECAINQVLYLDECLPLVSLGRACVVSIQCTGAGECVEGVCDCPAGTTRKGDRCERKTPMASVASPTSFRPTIDGATNQNGVLSPSSTIHKVCPASRLPHIANGAPLQCIAGQACPSGYSCVYSRTAINYYCCSTSFEPKTKASTETCTSGEPLLYPTTGEALQCSRTRRCPKGFICKRHPSTKLFYCCTIPKTLDMEQYISRVKEIVKTREKLQSQINFFSPPRRVVKKPSCPNNFVLFETEINRKLVRRCQSSCPPAMSAVDGVCKSDIGPLRSAQKARP